MGSNSSLVHKLLLFSFAVGFLFAFSVPFFISVHEPTRLLIGWNSGIWTFLISILWVMLVLPHKKSRFSLSYFKWHSSIILIILISSSVVCMFALADELGKVEGLQTWLRRLHIGLGISTILSSWMLTHVIFSMIYSHEYYQSPSTDSMQALAFQDTSEPDHLDFLYFSFCFGVSNTTADVGLCSRRLRAYALVHAVVTFFFNTAILGLAISMIGGLI